MNDQELRKLLEQLHQEIEHTKTVDDRDRELLRDLGAHITDLLDRSGKVSLKTRPLTIQRLEDSISDLETAHPTLTNMISKLLATLSNAGI